MGSPTRCHLYIAGGLGGGSIATKVHEYVASTLGLNWTCDFLQLSSANEVISHFRQSSFAGGLVTMPHKRTVIPHLDKCDDLVHILGACNCVWLDAESNLRGTNTDWAGVYEAILAATPDHIDGRVAMVYGAGGASRAVIYALWAKLGCSKIYLLNRDEEEVLELIDDVHRLPRMYWPEVVHVKTLAQCKDLSAPYYTVCAVPDLEATTMREIYAESIFVELLSKENAAGALVLDMCYHPPMTKNLRLAAKYGYKTIQGQIMSAAQFSYQWKLWTGEEIETNGVFEMMEKTVMG